MDVLPPGWVVECLVWFIDCLVSVVSLGGGLTVSALAGRMADFPIIWLVDWLIDWLVDLLVVWLAGWLTR